MDPIYTPDNCKPAYQLRWSLSIFAHNALPPADVWLEPLKSRVEADDIRLLEHSFRPPSTNQFLLSTTPGVVPHSIIRSIKGRLQNLLQDEHPKAFRRNYWLATIGSANREAVERYVSDQLGHHKLADPQSQESFKPYQLEFPEVNLSQPQASAHGRYLYNLHLVLAHRDRWCDVDTSRLDVTREMPLKTAGKKAHRISRLALLADHLHATIGCAIDESPQSVALAYMNILAFAHGMKSVFCFSYYVGSFGEYDMNAVRPSDEEAGGRGEATSGEVL